MKKICLFIASFVLSLVTTAQSNSSDGSQPTQFKLSTFYISQLNYYGRTDSLKSSGFFPMAELWFGEKFYINAAPVFINNKNVNFQYAGTISTAGYQSKSNNQKFFTHLFLTKPFYQNSSVLPQSVLKAQIGLNFAHQNKILNINTGTELRFSDKMDYGFNAGLDHIVRKQIDNKLVLVLDPSIYVNAGTQQFTKSYYKKTTGFPGFPGGEQLVTEEVNKLDILSYEISMPVIIAINKLQLIVNPSYVLPQNIITTEGNVNNGDGLFYISAGLKYSF